MPFTICDRSDRYHFVNQVRPNEEKRYDRTVVREKKETKRKKKLFLTIKRKQCCKTNKLVNIAIQFTINVDIIIIIIIIIIMIR